MSDVYDSELSDNLAIVTKDTNDILDGMDFENEDERNLCNDIILNLEKQIVDNIQAGKIAALPKLGSIRINPVKQKFKEEKANLRLLRKVCTKAEYKKEAAAIHNKLREEQEKLDKDKLKYHKLKQRNRKQYEIYCKNNGKLHADTYLYCLSLIDYVPFNAEWEDHYQSLKD